MPSREQDDNELMCKLLQLLDKSEMLKNSRARMKRVKLVKIQMATIKRKKTLQRKSLTPGRRFFGNKLSVPMLDIPDERSRRVKNASLSCR